MSTFNYKLKDGKNRALICYCNTSDGEKMRDAIKTVFESLNIGIEPFIDDGSDTVWTIAHVIKFAFPNPHYVLNVALSWGETARRLLVGDNFSGVCVGVFFYDAAEPVDTRGTMAEVNEFFGEEIAVETPSVSDYVCAALKKEFGGVYGASEFVIPKGETSYALDIE